MPAHTASTTLRLSGPTTRGGRPVVGHRREVDLHVRPLGLQPALEPRHHARRAAGGRRHQEMMVGEARGDAVVHHHAVLVEHQAVAAAADAELRPRVRVDPVEERRGVRPLDVDLAERRRVHDGHAVARGEAFARDGGMQILARLREVPRPLPLADVLEERAVLLVPRVERGLADGIERVAEIGPGDGAERDGRVVGTERRRARARNVLAQRLREDRHAVDVAELALVGAEAHRGVALGVLDRVVALARGEHDVGRGDVVLQVDELLRTALDPARRRHHPHGQRAAPRARR